MRRMKTKRATREAFEKLAGEICDKYCRFPYEYDEEKEGMTLQDAICRHCPMNKLEDLFNVRAD